jgi:predicted O-methyltransferase YrrM
MSPNGRSMYASLVKQTLPPLVRRALAAAEELDFGLCVHPATGPLLQVLAGGVPAGGLVGETGTGTGVGLAWMANIADPSVELLSVEVDADRAAAAQLVFTEAANVTVIHGDAGELFERAPFDLLAHDGGWGAGKGPGEVVDPSTVLTPGGTMTVDDFTPIAEWPPTFNGELDVARHHWLTHSDVMATEVRVAEAMAVLVIRRILRFP